MRKKKEKRNTRTIAYLGKKNEGKVRVDIERKATCSKGDYSRSGGLLGKGKKKCTNRT